MDKSEYNLKIEELKTAMHAHDFEKAVDVADSLDIKKIRDNNLLSLIADAYELTGDNEQAKKILLMAYENTNTGRQLAYRLCLISIKLKELDEANEFYQDFIEMAPRDSARFILKYKMAKAKKKPVEELIKILEDYVNIDMEEKWAYELAKLYDIAGEGEKCVNMCDEISLWFAEGKYVVKAMDLKKKYESLTSTQQDNYNKKSENKSKEQEEKKASTQELMDKIMEKTSIKSRIDEAVKEAGYDSMEAAAEDGTAFVFMGHGTSHVANISYDQMQTQMEQLGYKNVFIGTVEGEPEDTECQAVIEKIKEAGYKKVILRPLMVVAGDHANNDMAGDDDDSWKSQFEASKAFDSVESQIAGLGEIDAIQQIYVAHTKAAIEAK